MKATADAMTTMTIRIPVALKKRAEHAAISADTNLSAVVRCALEKFADSQVHPTDGTHEAIPEECLRALSLETLMMQPGETVVSDIGDLIGIGRA